MATQNVASTTQKAHSKFFFYAAIGCLLTAFLGFTPTYFSPIARGSFNAHPIVHIHGIVFFAWTLFFVFQTWLVANGRTTLHRETGMLGISLATAMLFLGLMVGAESGRRAAAAGFALDGIHFMAVPVSGIVLFAVLIGFAIGYAKNRDVHKRLMLIATASIVDAAIARLFLTFLAPPPVPGASPVPPLVVTIPPAILADLFIVAGMVHDWRTRGKIHPVYFIAGSAVVAVHVLRVPFAATAAWESMARWLLNAVS